MSAVTISLGMLLRHAPELDPGVAADFIAGAMGRASRIAPCISADDFPYADEATAIIRDAILRRIAAGVGAVTTTAAGPFSETVDTRSSSRRSLSPEDEADLRALCQKYRGAAPAVPVPHASFPASPLMDRRYRAALGITQWR